MKKIILGLGLLSMQLIADVVSVVPYVGYMDYNKDVNQSLKESSILGGLYANVGNLNYLLELNYGYMDTKYKSSVTSEHLKQHDVTLSYSYYKPSYMMKLGAHYISTNDVVLGDGIVGITSLGGYTYSGYDKYSYGVDGYFSYYKEGRGEDSNLSVVAKPVKIGQISPYFSFFKSISLNASNLLSLVVNYEYAPDYVQKSYLSFELSDTFYYRSFFMTLSAYTGEMRSGVKKGGMSVFNTLDLMKYGREVKLGYYLTPALVADISYSENIYEEYSLTQETRNAIAVMSLSYRF